MLKKEKRLFLARVCCASTLLALIVLIAIPAFAETETVKESRINEARNSVGAFCKAEFDGDDFNQRVKLIKYSVAREKMEKKRTGPASAWVVFWDWDPYYIVSTYKVVNVEVTDGKAVATVEYKRLAESKGKEKIVPSGAANDIVKLNLVHDGKQWFVFDPPLPRISKDRLIKIYEDKLRGFDDKWRANASNEQKKSYARVQEALKVIKSL
jgi:hypothetical protein